MYGIAALMVQGMSIDDIFDPKKGLDLKRKAGEYYSEISSKDDKKELLEFYEKATEVIMDKLSYETKDSLLENTKDIKNALLRKVLFDINQRFGVHKNTYKALLRERHKNEPNVDQIVEEKYHEMNHKTDYIQALNSLEFKPFKILAEMKADAVKDQIFTYETWNKIKEDVKKVNKESTPEFLEKTINDGIMYINLTGSQLIPLEIDVEEFFAEQVTDEASLDGILDSAKQFKERSVKKAELEEARKSIPKIAEFQTILDVKYNYNQAANEIAKVFFGENASREVQYGEPLNFMSTGMKDQGAFQLEQSGLAYAAAILLAQGMSIESVLDPSKNVEEKLKAGQRVQEMAARGEEGRREMALLAAEAMRRLSEERVNNLPPDVLSNVSNFTMNFAAQIMSELKRETAGALNLQEAYEHKFKNEKPNLSDKEVKNWAQQAFERTQASAEPYEEVQEYHDLNEKRMFDHLQMSKTLGVPMESKGREHCDIEFQKNCFEKVYEDLLAVDPKLVRSSSEFKGMRAAVEDILELYKNADELKEQDFYNKLDEKCSKFASFNEKYLEKKKDIQPKEGSNAKKRLDFARKIKDFTKAARDMAKNSNKMYTVARTRKIKAEFRERQSKINDAVRRFEDIASPSTERTYFPSEEKDVDFMKRDFEVKKEENNFKVPDTLNLSKEQASLLVMISTGTIEVSKINTNVTAECEPEVLAYVTTAPLVEDVHNMRDAFFKEKMLIVERGRSVVKNALDHYEKGGKKELGKLLAEGMKRFAASFSNAEYGIIDEVGNHTRAIAGYKLAADIYDMISKNQELKELLSDDSLGENKITKETLESYRGAKVTYEVYQKAEQAKMDLLDMDLHKERTPEQKQQVKEALAALVLKNIVHKKLMTDKTAKEHELSDYLMEKYGEFGDLDLEADPGIVGKYTQDSYAKQCGMPMGKNQRELDPAKMKVYMNKLVNSKTIETMEKSLDANKLITMFEKEETFFEKVTENIMKKEPTALNVKEKEVQAEIDKQKTMENPQITM
jgi:hypothetical protein